MWAGLPTRRAWMEEASGSSYEVQRIFVMRHGEREDSRNPLWKRTAVRPYDTPITKRGEAEARRKWQGNKRTELSVRHIAIIVLLQKCGQKHEMTFLALYSLFMGMKQRAVTLAKHR